MVIKCTNAILNFINGIQRSGKGDDRGWDRLDGREFEWTPGVADGQGSLVCCDSWGPKESDMTEYTYTIQHYVHSSTSL